jgi:hypothetical protein
MNVRFSARGIAVKTANEGHYYFWDTSKTEAYDFLSERPTFVCDGLSALMQTPTKSERLMSQELLTHVIQNTAQQFVWTFSPSEQERLNERLSHLHRAKTLLESLN